MLINALYPRSSPETEAFLRPRLEFERAICWYSLVCNKGVCLVAGLEDVRRHPSARERLA